MNMFVIYALRVRSNRFCNGNLNDILFLQSKCSAFSPVYTGQVKEVVRIQTFQHSGKHFTGRFVGKQDNIFHRAHLWRLVDFSLGTVLGTTLSHQVWRARIQRDRWHTATSSRDDRW